MALRGRERTGIGPLPGWSAVALLLVAGVPAGPAAVLPLPSVAERAIAAVDAAGLRDHVEALASDRMAGRGLGQPGNRAAEAYVAEALRRAGVPPAGIDHLQPIELYQPRLGTGGRLQVSQAGGSRIADFPVGAHLQPHPASMPYPASGRVLFLGHGISAPRLDHDDYRGVDAKGAVVFVEEGAPDRLSKKGQDEEVASLERKVADADRHGAAAIVIVQPSLPDLHHAWPETAAASSASYRIYPRTSRLAAAVISEHAASGIRRAVEQGVPLHASIAPGVVVDPFTAHNVVGLVEGRDRGGRQMVVVGAHLDHEGTDAAGRIYNGADDNASGTAAVLAVAGAFARAAREGGQPGRAVAFAFWNGEEQGSLGAEAFARAPRPDRRIVANINLDMVGRSEEADPGDPRFSGFPRRAAAESANLVHVLGYTRAPALARLVRAANARIGLDIRQEYDRGAQNLLQRSDHWIFLRRGIPAVFLTTGLHPDYHTPADDADRVDYGKLERIAELAARAAWLAADAKDLDR
jgi:hypothetical protein